MTSTDHQFILDNYLIKLPKMSKNSLAVLDLVLVCPGEHNEVRCWKHQVMYKLLLIQVSESVSSFKFVCGTHS